MINNGSIKKIETRPLEGVFFKEQEIKANDFSSNTEWGIVNVFDDVVYQEILGFGGAFTESAAYIYSLLSEADKKRFLELYFDREKGIAYNFGRTHINSCDFSLGIYSSVEEGDKTLESFNLEREKKYILPFLKDALAYSKEEIVLFASPWSPPAYMKDNNDMLHGGKLLEEYKSVWAHYYAKYIKAMAAEGVKISAISVQNEPNATQTWESCNYSPEDEAQFIEKYLIDALDEEGLSDIKIMIWDHNKECVYDRAKKILSSKKVNERVWAVAHHWYSGDHFEGLRLVHEQLKKPVITGEFCGPITDDVNVVAERYGIEICENFNNYNIASCDWNLMLNQNGGPFHNRNAKTEGELRENKEDGCYAPILYDTEKQELQVTPIYYYIGHFSKYVMRGAKRVATTKHHKDLYTCAFVNPDGSKVCVVINTSDKELYANLRYNGGCTKNILKPHSIITLVF
ncbi:MAG: glucosylceramidase [Ruminococcaceae bacterium]|nr:glucosylceramidase [Oscillospiraceae bacterium]